jgi:hypothetical protein
MLSWPAIMAIILYRALSGGGPLWSEVRPHYIFIMSDSVILGSPGSVQQYILIEYLCPAPTRTMLTALSWPSSNICHTCRHENLGESTNCYKVIQSTLSTSAADCTISAWERVNLDWIPGKMTRMKSWRPRFRVSLLRDKTSLCVILLLLV